MFADPAEDPRIDPGGQGSERETLTGFLDWQRATLELKCDGLSAEQLASRSLAPSELSLLGLVRHLADVERIWFRRVLAGQDVPLRYVGDSDQEFTGALPDPAIVADAWQSWHDEVAFASEFTGSAPDLYVNGKTRYHGRVTLRWVLIHMIEEYARHLGHADLLRERIDGRVGQ
jgi:uncharacterized damage-inducible protein DinB